MSYEETVTFKHSKEVREAMRLLKAEYKARKKAKFNFARPSRSSRTLQSRRDP